MATKADPLGELVDEDRRVVVPDAPYSQRGKELAPPGAQPGNLMQALAVAAANPAMDVAKVKELFAMHKELQDREAAQAFADALARAQARIQPIAKDQRNDHTKSMYATLAAIVDEVTPIMAGEGLAISFDTFNPERDKDLPPLEKGWVRVIALVSHRGGHTRKYHLDGPLDDAGKDGTKNKTGIQAMGSTVQYLRRYLVCMIGNIATYDGEDDGNQGNGGSATGKRMDDSTRANYLAEIDASADEAGVNRVFAVAYNKAEDLKDKSTQRQLIEARDAAKKKLREKGQRRS